MKTYNKHIKITNKIFAVLTICYKFYAHFVIVEIKRVNLYLISFTYSNKLFKLFKLGNNIHLQY